MPGVEAVRQGLAKPIGSLSQMGTIQLGKRTEGSTPLIEDFVPLAELEGLVFTGWDIFGGDLYTAAKTTQVLDRARWTGFDRFLKASSRYPLSSISSTSSD